MADFNDFSGRDGMVTSNPPLPYSNIEYISCVIDHRRGLRLGVEFIAMHRQQ